MQTLYISSIFTLVAPHISFTELLGLRLVEKRWNEAVIMGKGHLQYQIEIKTIGHMSGIEKIMGIFEHKRDKTKKPPYTFRSFRSLGPFERWKPNSTKYFHRLLGIPENALVNELGKSDTQTCWKKPDGSIVFVLDCYSNLSKEALNGYFISKLQKCGYPVHIFYDENLYKRDNWIIMKNGKNIHRSTQLVAIIRKNHPIPLPKTKRGHPACPYRTKEEISSNDYFLRDLAEEKRGKKRKHGYAFAKDRIPMLICECPHCLYSKK